MSSLPSVVLVVKAHALHTARWGKITIFFAWQTILHIHLRKTLAFTPMGFEQLMKPSSELTCGVNPAVLAHRHFYKARNTVCGHISQGMEAISGRSAL
jgi:hypothetical protein